MVPSITHRCRPPDQNEKPRIKNGAHYECRCGTRYVLTDTRFGRDWLPIASPPGTAPMKRATRKTTPVHQ